MIRIDISKLKDELEADHRYFLNQHVRPSVDRLKKKQARRSVTYDFCDVFLRNMNWLCTLKPDQLQNYSFLRHFSTRYHVILDPDYKDFRDAFKRATYGKFTDTKDPDNWAFRYVQKLNIKACPYCNRQFISALKDKMRPHLDHFLPFSANPHLGVSLFNLIPSCFFCNSNLKGRNTTPLVHPFVKGFEDDAKFKISLSKRLKHLGFKDFLPQNVSDGLKLESISGDVEIENSISVFRLLDIYQENHGDFIEEILLKKYIYDNEGGEALLELTKIIDSPAMLRRLVLGVYTDPYEYHKRPLSKFVTDLADDLGLFKQI